MLEDYPLYISVRQLLKDMSRLAFMWQSLTAAWSTADPPQTVPAPVNYCEQGWSRLFAKMIPQQNLAAFFLGPSPCELLTRHLWHLSKVASQDKNRELWKHADILLDGAKASWSNVKHGAETWRTALKMSSWNPMPGIFCTSCGLYDSPFEHSTKKTPPLLYLGVYNVPAMFSYKVPTLGGTL